MIRAVLHYLTGRQFKLKNMLNEHPVSNASVISPADILNGYTTVVRCDHSAPGSVPAVGFCLNVS